jgi:hypothetical protein
MLAKHFNPYNEPIFQKGFEIAEISHLNVEQFDTLSAEATEIPE